MQHPTWEELTDYLDKTLAADRHQEVEAHIATCDACSEQIEWLYKSTGLLRADTFVPPPRKVRVAAESLFDLRFGKSGAPEVSPAVTPNNQGASPTSVKGSNVIPLPVTPRTPQEDKILRPNVSVWRRMAWIGGAVAALLVITFFALQPRQGPLVAAVQGQEGEVDIRSTNNGFSLPFTGSTLNEGSSIATGADGSAQLVFANGAVRVVMLEESNLIYLGGMESEGALSRVALATDQAGDLEVDVQSGVTVDLQTGVGLFTTTGGRFRFHYLEPRIVGVQVLRGTVTVRSDHGVYDLEEGTDEVLDYTQPVSSPTPEPTNTPSPTPVPPTATAVPATPTALPTRLAPSATVADTSSTIEDEDGEEANEPEPSPTGNTNGSGSSGTTSGTLTSSPTATLSPSATATVAQAQEAQPENPTVPEEPQEEGNPEEGDNGDTSGGGNDHDSEHDDNSGSGSGNSGSGGGGGDHDEEHDHD